MRVTLERDGRRAVVEVAPDLASVEIEGRRFPVRVLSQGALRVELEIAGETVVVDQWPEHFPSPPAAVEVDGERWTVHAEVGSVGVPSSTPPSIAPAPPAPSSPVPGPPGQVPIVPPMPGRVIELKVREGDRVDRGDVLLVLEAMKMRNELTSPVAGVVRGLRITPGANARTREPMMYVVPD